MPYDELNCILMHTSRNHEFTTTVRITHSHAFETEKSYIFYSLKCREYLNNMDTFITFSNHKYSSTAHY